MTGPGASSHRGNPYVGPRPFQTGELLYGRNRDFHRLLDLLIAERILLMYSPSGAGKTSLIHACLVPALEQPEAWKVRLAKTYKVKPPMRVGRDAPQELLVPNRYVWSALASLEEKVEVAERSAPDDLARMTLLDYFGTLAPGDPYRVLIFDQFEEILTTNPVDLEEKRQFFLQLGELLENPKFLALISMREDYLAGLDPYAPLIPNRLDGRFRLEYLKVEQAREAILNPLPSGFVFEPEALQELLDSLRQVKVRGASEPAKSEWIEPYQLQVVCTRIWDADGDPHRISLEDVRGRGDVEKALGAYYADKVREIAGSPDSRVRERVLREWIEANLISPRGFRGQVEVDPSGVTNGLENPTIRLLDKAWLVREDNRPDGSSWFELAHDRLIGPIREDNARWREENLQLYQRQAQVWAAAGQPRDELLLSDKDLKETERRLVVESDEPTDLEREFLKRCRAASEARRRANLDELGWGVIFPHDADPAIREALAPLLDHRRSRAGDRYREFAGGEQGHRPGMTYQQFLDRHGVQLGPADYTQMPYYLLIIGSPESIPFKFQYGLDMTYAVGRIHFDAPEDYARYARGVVDAEARPPDQPRAVAFFAPQHLLDQGSSKLIGQLVVPLEEAIRKAAEGWDVRSYIGSAATKATLGGLLGGRDTPALLFVAGQGPSFPLDDPRQRTDQGALFCQEWPGALRRSSLRPAHYFAASDLADNAQLGGLIAFLFGPYSAGTPYNEDFPPLSLQPPRQLACEAFVAPLAQRLLGHPRGGGALAVIGHVERTWGWSFASESNSREPDIVHFSSCLERLLDGHTVGSALELFNWRYTRRSIRLVDDLRHLVAHGASDEDKDRVYRDMVATIDARNYIILGDPAVRLPAAVAPPRGPTVPRAGLNMPATSRSGSQKAPTSFDDEVIFNGIDASTGNYFTPPVTLRSLAALVRGQGLDSAHRAELKRWLEQRAAAFF
jgi:hypothetical protein